MESAFLMTGCAGLFYVNNDAMPYILFECFVKVLNLKVIQV